MTLRQRILDIAASQQGVTEAPPGSNSVLYWDWWANADGTVDRSEVLGAWCAAFVSWVYDKAGAPLPAIQRDRGGFAGVQAGVQYAVNNDELTQDPTPGDIALFSWLPVVWDDGYPRVYYQGQWTTAGDHTGIFSHFDGEQYWCWEGNTSVHGSQDNGGAVHLRPRPPSVIIGFWSPAILRGAPGPLLYDTTTQGDDMPTHLTTLNGSWWGCFTGLYRPLSGPELAFYQSKGVPTVTHTAAEIATMKDSWGRFA
jgi:hypothetical protein